MLKISSNYTYTQHCQGTGSSKDKLIHTSSVASKMDYDDGLINCSDALMAD